MIIFKVLFFISFFIVFWANIGYPLSILMLGKIMKNKENTKKINYQPTVTVMVVAHNEEQVIIKKLNNLKEIDYASDRIKYLIASDNSTDNTNSLVENFIKENPEMKLSLYKAKNRLGKTNAQNEAQKLVKSEYLVMTDANAILKKDSIKELMSSFISDDISYVTGKLVYINGSASETSKNESSYWNLDLKVREIESRIQTITAGNGALYACRNSEYVDFDPIKSHDSSMPIYYALKGKRAIANHDAIAYEKAGENTEDEFNRKVRMNRVLLQHILPSFKILNIFKYKWFTYFYLGHRTSRYLLWIMHTLLFISNLFLVFQSKLYLIAIIFQAFFYSIGFINQFTKLENSLLNLISYYTMTMLAQWYGIINTLTGKSKPFWEKAETTR